MESVNPYESPDANLEQDDQHCYQPKILAMNGRIGRARYFCYSMVVNLVGGLLLALVFGIAMAAMGAEENSLPMIVGMVVIYLPLIVYSVIAGKRRLNDLNRSGWFMLLYLIPFINILFGLYVLLMPGTKGVNNFGLPPSKNGASIYVAGIFGLIIGLGILAAVAIPAYQAYISNI